MTININRLVQDAVKEWEGKLNDPLDAIQMNLENQVAYLHKYLTAFNAIIKENQANRMNPLYDAGFVTPEKQYLTIGVNGFVEGAEFLGIEINDNETYTAYVETILGTISDLNKKAKTDEIMFNTEFVPAESLGVKNAQWDKRDGYVVPRDCYNSYFYKVEDESLNVLDKFKLYSHRFTDCLDGGSALHMNLREHLSKEQYAKLLEVAIQQGCTYFTYNIPNTICDDCGHISKHYVTECPHCHSKNVDYLTRVIGFLVRVSKMSASRQVEAKKRFYA
jgi:ribonucleoside-triphosphate reductase